MDILLTLLITLLALDAILLIAIIMLQGAQEDGNVYGPSSSSKMQYMKMIGPAHAPNLLEKITGSLAALLIVLVLASSYVIKQRHTAKYQPSQTLEKAQSYIVSNQKDKNSLE